MADVPRPGEVEGWFIYLKYYTTIIRQMASLFANVINARQTFHKNYY